MEKIDPSLVDNKLIFPDDETLSATFDFMPLTSAAADRVRRRLVRCHRWLRDTEAPRRGARSYDGLRLRNVTKSFGAFTAVDDLDLDVPRGSFFALLGPSGCGKTTTLRMVAGLETPTSGSITLAGQDITYAKPYRRPVNTVFQSYALFPHLDIHENVAFGLKRRKSSDVDTAGPARCSSWSSSTARPARSRPSSPAASSSGSRSPGR